MLLKILDILFQIFVFCVIFGGICSILYVVDRFFKENSKGPSWYERYSQRWRE